MKLKFKTNKLLFTTIITLLLFMIFPINSALACELRIISSSQEVVINETVKITIERVKTHKVCLLPLEATKIEILGGSIVEEETWVTGTTDIKIIYVKFDVAGIGTIRVTRNCSKVGLMEASIKIKVNPMVEAPKPPVIPILKAPLDNSQIANLNPTLEWQSPDVSVTYTLQISKTADFNSLIYAKSGISQTNYKIPESILGYESSYYWRVKADYKDISSNFSSVFYFKTPKAPQETVKTEVPKVEVKTDSNNKIDQQDVIKTEVSNNTNQTNSLEVDSKVTNEAIKETGKPLDESNLENLTTSEEATLEEDVFISEELVKDSKVLNEIVETLFAAPRVYYLLLTLLGLILVLLKKFFLRPFILLLSLAVLGFYYGGCSCPTGYLYGIINFSAFTYGGLGVLIILGIIALITLFKGRVFCGWVCPHGALQEFLHRNDKKRKINEKIDFYLKNLKYIILIVFIAGSIYWAKNLFCVLDPFKVAYNLSGTGFVLYLLMVILGSSLILYRPFCKYLCPFGAYLGMISWIGKVLKINKTEIGSECIQCKACVKSCSMQDVILQEESYIKNLNECISCGDCRKVCPKK